MQILTRLLSSRRTMTALYSITCLMVLGLVNNIDTSVPIATIAAAMCASNAYQKKGGV